MSKAKVKRTTITLPGGLFDRAERAMRQDDFSSFSDYIQHLIREDTRSVELNEPAPQSASSSPPSERPIEEVASALGQHAVAEVSRRKPVIGASSGRKYRRGTAGRANPGAQPKPPTPAPK